jgi:hypothetical protein
MSIAFFFHYGDGEDHIEWIMELGQVPPVATATYFKPPRWIIPRGTGHPLNFGPGQKMTISFTDEEYDSIKAKIEASMPFSTVTKCVVGVDDVYFEDQGEVQGLKWARAGFGYALPDADSPKGYKRLPVKFLSG